MTFTGTLTVIVHATAARTTVMTFPPALTVIVYAVAANTCLTAGTVIGVDTITLA
jgi:hypothetical protein